MTDPEVLKRLERIETILLQMPEVMSATFITMWEEWQKAKFCGRSAKDLWTLIPPNFDQNQLDDVADPPASQPSSGEN